MCHIPKAAQAGCWCPWLGRQESKCPWRTASAKPYLLLPPPLSLLLIEPIHEGMTRLSWPGWLITCRDGCPSQHNRARCRVTLTDRHQRAISPSVKQKHATRINWTEGRVDVGAKLVPLSRFYSSRSLDFPQSLGRQLLWKAYNM